MDTMPDWVSLGAVEGDKLSCAAAPVMGDDEPTRRYDIVIKGDDEIVVAFEGGSNFLPKYCPERHINPGGGFCLGLRAEIGVVDKASAERWWEKLKLSLLCQETAHLTRRWPEMAKLSHGSAGEVQVEAEALARELCQEKEYEAALYDEGPIANSLWLLAEGSGRLMNGRASCVCGHKGKRGRLILRRECSRTRAPCLVAMEQKRRDAEELFWQSMKGVPCCGTLDDCPLNPNWRKRPSKLRTRRK